jgi:hypothetical protein
VGEPNPAVAQGAAVATAAQPAGAFVRMLYVERELKGYAITASEVRQLGSLNRIATLFFALGSGAVGYGLGVWWDVATQPTDPIVQRVGTVLLYGCGAFAVLCFVVAGVVTYTRWDEINKILGESKSG